MRSTQDFAFTSTCPPTAFPIRTAQYLNHVFTTLKPSRDMEIQSEMMRDAFRF